jgi:hypothetical protein
MLLFAALINAPHTALEYAGKQPSAELLWIFAPFS